MKTKAHRYNISMVALKNAKTSLNSFLNRMNGNNNKEKKSDSFVFQKPKNFLSFEGKENNPPNSQRSRIDNQVQQFNCAIHPKKRAKYIIDNSDGKEVIYCSKCAVALASKGIKMREMPDELERPSKVLFEKTNDSRVRLDNFLNGLEIMIPESERTLSELNNRKVSSLKHFEKQVQKVNGIYENLSEILNESQSKALSSINIFRERYIEASTQYEKETKRAIWELKAMFSDVSSNRDSITKEIEDEVLHQILTKYEDKLIHSQAVFKTLQSEQITLHHVDEGINYGEFQNILETKVGFHPAAVPLLPVSNEVYVSFENGEFFRNQIKTDSTKESRNNTDQTDSGEKTKKKHKRGKSSINLAEIDINTGKKSIKTPEISICLSAKNTQNQNKTTPENTKEKYLNLLNKIASNQSKFESNCDELKKNRPIISPKYNSSGDENERILKTEGIVFEELEFKNFKKNFKTENEFTPKSTPNSVCILEEDDGALNTERKHNYSESKSNTVKSEKEEGLESSLKFYSFIEKKLEEQDKAQKNRNFQKTLFCSPSFKDHSETNGNDSLWLKESVGFEKEEEMFAEESLCDDMSN